MRTAKLAGVLFLILAAQRAAIAEVTADDLAELKSTLSTYDAGDPKLRAKFNSLAWTLIRSPKASEAVVIMAPYLNSGKVPFKDCISVVEAALVSGANISPLAEFCARHWDDTGWDRGRSSREAMFLLMDKGDLYLMEELAKGVKGSKRLFAFVQDYFRDHKSNTTPFGDYVEKHGNSMARFAAWSANYDERPSLSKSDSAILAAFRHDADVEVAAAAEAIWRSDYDRFGLGQFIDGAGRVRRNAIASALAEGQRDQKYIEMARSLLENPDDTIRAEAWECVTACSNPKRWLGDGEFVRLLTKALDDKNPVVAEHAVRIYSAVYDMPPRPRGLDGVLMMLACPSFVLLGLAVWGSLRRRSKEIAKVMQPDFERAGNLGIGLGLGMLVLCAILAGIVSMAVRNPKLIWMTYAPLMTLLMMGTLGVSIAVWGHRSKNGMMLDAVMLCVLAGIAGALAALSMVAGAIYPDGSMIGVSMMVCSSLIAVIGGACMYRIIRAQRSLGFVEAG